MNKVAVCIVLACLICGINAVLWTNCEGIKTQGEALAVSVNGDKTKCELIKGTTAQFNLIFKPSVASKNMTAVVHGQIGPVFVPFFLKDPDVCNNHGVKCPVKGGVTYSYTTGIDVLKAYPAMSVIVKWENQNDNEKDVLCVYINCEIKSPGFKTKLSVV